MDTSLLFFSRTYDYLNIYLPKHKNGSKHTQNTYKIALRDFKNYTNVVKGIPTNKFYFTDCTYDYFLDYRNYLHDIKKLKESTTNNKLATVRSYISYAAARDTSLVQVQFSIDRVPFYTVPKVHQPIIEEVDSLSALLNQPGNTKTGFRDKVLMSLLYDSAVRAAELSSIRIKDIKMTGAQFQLLIHGKGDKERILYLDEKTSALVQQYVSEFHPDKNPETPLFYATTHGNKHPITVRNIEKRIKKYSDITRKEHELPDSVSPHTFRRTRGTYMYRDGIDIGIVARHLGHSNIQTTIDHYTTPSHEQLKEVAKKRTESIPDEEQMWPDDEEQLAKELGLI